MSSEARSAATKFALVEMQLTPEDETMMVLTGFASRADDGILEITEKGSAWVSEWCQRKMKEVELRAAKAALASLGVTDQADIDLLAQGIRPGTAGAVAAKLGVKPCPGMSTNSEKAETLAGLMSVGPLTPDESEVGVNVIFDLLSEIEQLRAALRFYNSSDPLARYPEEDFRYDP